MITSTMKCSVERVHDQRSGSVCIRCDVEGDLERTYDSFCVTSGRFVATRVNNASTPDDEVE